jgi:hypothetical protein
MRSVLQLIRIFPVMVVAASLAGTLIGPSPVMGQTPPPGGNVTSTGSPGTQRAPGVGVVAPQSAPPSPEFGFEESIPLEQAGIREQQSFPEPNLGGVYAPAFYRAASTTVRTSQTSGARFGLSGWTATRIPYDDRNNQGGPALGFSLEWGKPLPPPPAEPAKPEAPAPPR